MDYDESGNTLDYLQKIPSNQLSNAAAELLLKLELDRNMPEA